MHPPVQTSAGFLSAVLVAGLLVAFPARAVSRRIDLHFQETSLRDCFLTIARAAGVNILIAPQVRGKVTLDVEDVDWKEALRIIAALHGLEVAQRNNVTAVGPPDAIKRVKGTGFTRLVPIAHGQAEDLAAKVNALYGDRFEATADARTNTLILTPR